MSEVTLEQQTIQWLTGESIEFHKCKGFSQHFRRSMYTPEFQYDRYILKGTIDKIRPFVNLNRVRKICDAGSGFGQTLVGLHQIFGMSADFEGIEYNADAVELANKMAKKANVNSFIGFKQGDVFKTDFSKYDLIYAYHPCTKGKKQLRFDRHILKSMKEGAHYLRVYRVSSLEELKMPKKLKITMPYCDWSIALYRKGDVPNVI